MKKLGHYFDVLWNWAVYSSANPGQISGTVKWALGACGTILTVVLGFGHIGLPSDIWTQLTDLTIQIVQTGLLFVTSVGTLVALLRKLYMSIRGEHASLNVITTK